MEMGQSTLLVLNMMIKLSATQQNHREKARWNTVPKSFIGFAAFPESKIRTPQGAAFAAARITNEMLSDNLIVEKDNGYYATIKGVDLAI